MAAPFQPGIAPPPLTPQGQPTLQTPHQTAGGPVQATTSGPTGASSSTHLVSTPSVGRPNSVVESERPQSVHGTTPIDPSMYMDDQYDHRCSLCIAAWGFAFLAGLTGAAGVLFLQQGLFTPTFKVFLTQFVWCHQLINRHASSSEAFLFHLSSSLLCFSYGSIVKWNQFLYIIW